MDISQDKIKLTERKVEYDVSRVVKGLQEANLSDPLREMIKLEFGIDIKDYLKSNAAKTGALSPQRALQAVRRLARDCHYEKQHSEHVAQLALRLFDELRPVLKLTEQDRYLLNCAGLLHDIGWTEGAKGHHKTAMRLILASQTLPFADRQRTMIALIARYHRKALPKDSHPVFSRLSSHDKQKTRILAGILRIADGLDRTHTNAVTSVQCDLRGHDLTIGYRAAYLSASEMETAREKSDLLKQALDKNIRFVVI
jgi:exopolyphosphatase/pppGpp-phosphohydrolase